jgi:recombinational DNA repair protein (RecF pathway)
VLTSVTKLKRFSVSYVTYTTKALVCGGFAQNTSDKSFLLFTRDAGMLFATARSVREEVSKQRCALQEFSRVRVSLVKGKQGWRVGSVEVEQNDFSLAKDREARGSVVMLHRLLRRFIRGEEASPDLYDFIILALDELLEVQPNRKLLDLFVQVRILAMLGYVNEATVPEVLRTSTPNQVAHMADDTLLKQLDKLATQATESSHL